MSKISLAITGTIGSGKSTVLEYIRSKGYSVFSCDEYNKTLLEKGSIAYDQIKKIFPKAFEENCLNKQKLANIIFNDKYLKKKLEDILHPLIYEELLRQKQENEIFIAEVPLLFETGGEKYFDYTLLIVTDKQIALERLLNRGLNRQEAINRINNQMPIKQKALRASEIIYNNSDLPALYKEVDKWLKLYVG